MYSGNDCRKEVGMRNRHIVNALHFYMLTSFSRYFAVSPNCSLPTLWIDSARLHGVWQLSRLMRKIR